MERKIAPELARVGMYVKGFSGSWFRHPFWRARFIITNARQEERIRHSGLDYVVIDDALGSGPEADEATEIRASSVWAPTQTRSRVPCRAPGAWAKIERPRPKSEQQQARALLTKSKKIVRKAFDDARLGRAVSVQDVAPVVEEIVCSIDKNPKALLNVLRLKKKNEYTYLHSVAVCTLMVNVAIHLARSQDEIRDYGIAGLLHDVGKMGVPDSILDKEGPLTDDEFRKIRNHSEYGHRILAKSVDIPEAALDVCLHHHEKMDGSGYPFGLASEEISPVARLGAICDVYDALTSNRAYKAKWTPARALAEMWSWDGHFDRDLLFTFMQSLGLFAPGMTVQLRSNRLGIVLEPKRVNSRTRVLAYFDTCERDWIEPVEVVIGDSLTTDGIVGVADPDDWGLGDLNSVDPKEILDRFQVWKGAA